MLFWQTKFHQNCNETFSKTVATSNELSETSKRRNEHYFSIEVAFRAALHETNKSRAFATYSITETKIKKVYSGVGFSLLVHNVVGFKDFSDLSLEVYQQFLTSKLFICNMGDGSHILANRFAPMVLDRFKTGPIKWASVLFMCQIGSQ